MRPASIIGKLRVDSGNPVSIEKHMIDANNDYVFVNQMLVVYLRFLKWSCHADVDYLSCLKVGQKNYLEITETSKVNNYHGCD